MLNADPCALAIIGDILSDLASRSKLGKTWEELPTAKRTEVRREWVDIVTRRLNGDRVKE